MTSRPYAVLTAPPATFEFFLGDCLQILPGLPSAVVQTIVTSPPYNLGIRYRSYDDGQPRERYLAWTSDWVRAAAARLTADGSFFLNVGAKPRDPWTAIDVALTVRPYLQLQNTLHWVKSIAIDREAAGAGAGLDRDLAVGHYKPINSRRFVNDCHEFIFHFTPLGTTVLDRLGLGVAYQDASNVTRWQGAANGRRCRGNTWFIPYETIQSRERERPHPATFPSRLPEYCLRLHGLSRVNRVLDPFLGLGSTAVACARLGLSFTGIEIDEDYLKEALARTREALARRAERPSPPAKRVTATTQGDLLELF